MKLRYTSLQVEVANAEPADSARPRAHAGGGRRAAQPARGDRGRVQARPAPRPPRVRDDRRRRACRSRSPSSSGSCASGPSSTPPSRAGTRSAATTKRFRYPAPSRSRAHVARRRRGGRRDGAGQRRHAHAARVQRLSRSGRCSTPCIAMNGVPDRRAPGLVRRSAAAAPRASRTTASPRSPSQPRAGCTIARADASAATRRTRSGPSSRSAGIDTRHEIVDVAPVGVLDLLEARDLQVESMGRPAAADPVLFESPPPRRVPRPCARPRRPDSDRPVTC